MRRMLLAGLAAGLCAIFGWAQPAAAKQLTTTIDLDYIYSQTDLGGDVNASTQFNQKYSIRYDTSLTTAYDFLGAVTVELQDAWYTDAPGTSRVAPTLQMEAKGSQLAAKMTYETVTGSTDSYHELSEVTTYSSGLSFGLDMTPRLWPELKLKYQTKSDFQDYSKESTTNTYELTARKDIHGLRLEYSLKREDVENLLPGRTAKADTKWSVRAAYRNVLRGPTEFEVAYEINEDYADAHTRGVFTGETKTYTQVLKTRLRNSLAITSRLKLGLLWEYQYEQDLLGWDFDYKLKNKYAIDLRWDILNSLKITSEVRRETEQLAAAVGNDDEGLLTDTFKAGFDLTTIPWMRVSGKAEFKNEERLSANSGGSTDKKEEEKYELIAKNTIGEFWDFTWNASTASKHIDDFLTERETKVRGDLMLKLLDLVVTPGYEVSRKNEGSREYDYLTGQKQIRNASIKFQYQMQLLEMFKATFSHEYSIKVEDSLDEVLNFDRILQFSEGTRLNIVLAEIIRDLIVEGEIERKGSDIADDPDPQLVELAYTLKMDWKFQYVNVLSSIKYNDKGSTFDDVSFNAKAVWKGDRLELTGEYQIDKIIKDFTEPKDEKRKLNLKLNYIF